MMDAPTYYLIIVVLLFILAIIDLVVGVSNDAVNFLNSSIASKVASRKTILFIAALGIIVGASFSSGMMEVARKGIFVPSMFTFDQVMIIFLAVMLADILLLDVFNTLGMPTSTTVSIVFELLGASVAIAWFEVSSGEGASTISDYLNSEKALAIIGGIFISVIFAFSIGALVQFFARLTLTFKYHSSAGITQLAFFGLCLTALSYFLVFKGLAGASFVSETQLEWVQRNLAWMSVVSLLVWMVVGVTLRAFGVDRFRVIVLFGTFALAMAFAGNDLVNFIGVSIAGVESYMIWSASGVDPSGLEMTALSAPVQTQTYLLLLAGGIMVVSLYFSKKAQSVTETEVNLGKHQEGEERFRSNKVSHLIVAAFSGMNNSLTRLAPSGLVVWMNQRFNQLSSVHNEDAPAFDLVRASINLTVASVLISIATSFQLPLSTTYVSFMVAMGTSLADRAWGAQSATNRVAGVMNVIGGWLMTALSAFVLAFIFARLIRFTGMFGILGLLLVVIYSIYRTFTWHQSR